MTVNLSFPDASRPTDGIEYFYTDLHDAMNDSRVADAPSAREFRQFLAREYPGSMDGLRCLDAGCGGTAVNSRTLVGAGAGAVVAVDVNRGSLQLVRALMSAASKRFSLACGSVLNLPFPLATFDFVVCSGVVHHTPDPEQALRELRRIVKPDARLYISAYCFEDSLMLPIVKAWRLAARVIPFSLMHRIFKRNRLVNNYVLDHMYVPLLWIYRAADFADLLERAGFSVDETFVSGFDCLHGRTLGPWSITGGGLLRIFICRPVSPAPRT
jgi:ubiquinone/menaquinone biosynthesis C-methylase UbiE